MLSEAIDRPTIRGERFDVRRLFGVLVAGVGFLNLASALLPPLRSRVRVLEGFVPLADQELALVLAVQAGLLLLFIARQLARGKRRAWQIAILLLVSSTVLHVVKGLDVEEALVSAALAAGLIVYRKRFQAASDVPSWSRLIRSLPFLVALPFVYGIGGMWLRRGDLMDGFSLSRAATEVAYRLVWMGGPVRFTDSAFRRWFPFSISLLAVVVAVRILFLAFRPVVAHVGHRTPEDEADLRRLVATDEGTLAYISLREDKNVFFNEERTAALGYRQVGGVALVAGDLVGDSDAWNDLVSSFAAYAHDHGWSLAGIGLSEKASESFTALGLRRVYVGDEAVIDPCTWSIDAPGMRKVRQNTANIARRGWILEMHRTAELHPDLRRALLHVSSSWKAGEEERGFSMALGRLFDPRDPDCVIAVARDVEGEVRAFLHFVPAGPHGYSLDVMRRDRDVPSALNEWLIVRTIEWMRERGVQEMSLNFAFLRSVIRPEGRQGPVIRLQRFIALKLGPWFQIESLYRFNNKFGPRWVPRYGVVEDRLSIPAVTLAALRAEKLLDLDVLRRTNRHKNVR